MRKAQLLLLHLLLRQKQATYTAALSCPDYYQLPDLPTTVAATTMTDAWQQRYNATLQKGILTNTLHNLEDGGNTPLLQSEVAMTQIQDAYALYANLIANSPYLSEEVLSDLAEKENFPKPLLRDVMVANKHAGKNVEVMQHLENRIDELPDYMLQQIAVAAESGLSGKELLEAAIAAQDQVIQAAISTQIGLLRADSTATFADYAAVLDNTATINQQTVLLDAALNLGSVAQANTVLADLHNHLTDAVEAAAASDYVQLYAVLIALKATHKTIDSLTAAQYATLKALAGDRNPAQITAMGILEIVDSVRTYEEPIPKWTPPTTQRVKKVTKPSPPSGDLGGKDFVRVSPNPAREYITIEFRNIAEQGIIEVFSASGTLVQTLDVKSGSYSQTISVANWANGLYIYRYSAHGTLIEEGKFEVIK